MVPVVVSRLPGLGPQDDEQVWLDALINMAKSWSQWRFYCDFLCPFLSRISSPSNHDHSLEVYVTKQYVICWFLYSTSFYSRFLYLIFVLRHDRCFSQYVIIMIETKYELGEGNVAHLDILRRIWLRRVKHTCEFGR